MNSKKKNFLKIIFFKELLFTTFIIIKIIKKEKVQYQKMI